ncbi:MAG: hypothetical protein JWP18_2293, partial [Solirubrobacterales bacterium]|nr:hypothetical protein [Solirubrobacterales bacterium]
MSDPLRALAGALATEGGLLEGAVRPPDPAP